MVSFNIERKPVPPEISRARPQYVSPTEPSIECLSKLPVAQEKELDGISSAQQLLRGEKSSSLNQEIEPSYVKWGVVWGVPAMMVSMTILGVAVGAGHHGYYTSLHGTPVGSFARQNWALRFGTAFSFLSIAFLRTACNVAYKQYIWTLLKRKAYSITAIDKLFSLTMDLTAFRSWELMRHADTAVALAIVCWLLPFAGIAPPATLSVGHGFSNETVLTSMPDINWRSRNISDFLQFTAYPSYATLQMASLSAKSMNVLQVPPPGQNVTFHRRFYGPTVQCALANATQQPVFDVFTEQMWNNSYVVGSRASFDTGNLKWQLRKYYNDSSNSTYLDIPSGTAPQMNVFSAFSPSLGPVAWTGSPGNEKKISFAVDEYNNWWPHIPDEVYSKSLTIWKNSNYHYYNLSNETQPFVEYRPHQTFIQAADQAIVCTLGNASFDVDFTFIDGAQTQAKYTISNFIPFWTPTFSEMMSSYLDPVGKDLVPPETFRELNSYMGIFTAFTSLLNGNVSTTLSNLASWNKTEDSYEFDGNAIVVEYTSEILQNGLSACPDFAHSSWDGDGAIGIGRVAPTPWRESVKKFTRSPPLSNDSTVFPGLECFANITNDLFKKPSWMCRNQTLLRGIEDLANNVTISMLSVGAFLTNNASDVEVFHFESINVYVYNYRNLVISYCFAVFFTLIAVGIGFWSLHFNGVAHSTNFSAIVGTTRNFELDKYVMGHSLGVFGGARGQGIGKGDDAYHAKLERDVRLRFGELVSGQAANGRFNGGSESGISSGSDEGVATGTARRLGFGSQENVVMLRKGGRYV